MSTARGARALAHRLVLLALFAAVAALLCGCYPRPGTYEEACSTPFDSIAGDDEAHALGDTVWVSAELGGALYLDVLEAAGAWERATDGRVRLDVRQVPAGDHATRHGTNLFACPVGSPALDAPDDPRGAGAVTGRDSDVTVVAVLADRAARPAAGLIAHELGHVLGLDDDRADLTALMADGPLSVRPSPGPRDLALWKHVAGAGRCTSPFELGAAGARCSARDVRAVEEDDRMQTVTAKTKDGERVVLSLEDAGQWLDGHGRAWAVEGDVARREDGLLADVVEHWAPTLAEMRAAERRLISRHETITVDAVWAEARRAAGRFG